MTGTIASTIDVSNSGTYDVDTTDTISSLSGTRAVEIVTDATMTTGDTEDCTISGIISGAGNLTKAGSGTLTFSGWTLCTGDVSISAGPVTFI